MKAEGKLGSLARRALSFSVLLSDFLSLSCKLPQRKGLVEGKKTMAGLRRYREPGGRMYDEPGVGARSGMRVKDGAFDLDDFLEAGRKALNQGSSIAHPTHADDDSDDESVGTARHAHKSPRASSSMLIVESE